MDSCYILPRHDQIRVSHNSAIGAQLRRLFEVRRHIWNFSSPNLPQYVISMEEPINPPGLQNHFKYEKTIPDTGLTHRGPATLPVNKPGVKSINSVAPVSFVPEVSHTKVKKRITVLQAPIHLAGDQQMSQTISAIDRVKRYYGHK